MDETNVLLLSMSTLNYVEESGYEGTFIDKKECYFRGVSQLEPGTKYYLRQMERRHKKIDKIFIVESPESTGNSVRYDAVRSFLSDPMLFVNPIEDAEENSVTNAVDFFKERIAQYIRGTEQSVELVDYTKLPIEKIEGYEAENIGLGAIYPQEFIEGELFSDIPIAVSTTDSQEEEEDLLNRSVQRLCNEIKKIAENNKPVNLYLDMQGAPRYVTFIINATVNMLDINSNIKVKQVIAIDYLKDNNKNGWFNQIVDTTFNDRMFKMVSGMNQFITTGRGDLLRQFFNNAQHLVNLKCENPIITSISNISDALSLCNMGKFNEEIDKFKEVLVTYKAEKKPNRLFQIFVEDLEADYNKYNLLDDEAKSPIINRANWCSSKGLYQQAMTLLEAHVPEDIVTNQIIYYGSDNDLEQLINAVRNSGWLKMDGNDTDSYALIHHLLSCFCQDESLVMWRLNKYIEQASQKFSSTMGDPDRDFRTAEELEEVNGEKSVKPKHWNREIGELLLHYDNIRNIRNKINHSDNNVKVINSKTLKEEWKKITVTLVKDEIKDFIGCYDQLLDMQVKVDLSEQFSIISD